MRCALTNTPDAKHFLPKDFEIFKQTKGYSPASSTGKYEKNIGCR